ncbi:Pol protein [Phytophthora palmivora]|uniref:Pol protein n=1 Tax=Phytophthora palmivora TaxID=4796 RepID=A0A2P4YQ91_9STRA|nr:Pol protein [Phytophthora palmivora]
MLSWLDFYRPIMPTLCEKAKAGARSRTESLLVLDIDKYDLILGMSGFRNQSMIQKRYVYLQSIVIDAISSHQSVVHLEALPEVSALLNLEELSMKDFLAELKAGEISEMVLLKPETSPEDLNSSSVMDEEV